MIFDFGRCIYEPKNWEFLSYFEGKRKNRSEYEKEYREEHGEHATIEEVEMMKACCRQFAMLFLYLEDDYTVIYFFDGEIEEIKKAIRASRKRGDNYVFYHGNLYDNVSGYKKEVRVSGEVATY